MLMEAVKLIFILACLFISVYAQTRNLGGVLRDQAPSGMCPTADDRRDLKCGTANSGRGFPNTDFQREDYEDYEYGLCGAQCTQNNLNTCGRLGKYPDETPQYVFSGRSPKGNVLSPASFYNWFHNTNQTKVVPFDIPLRAEGDVYVYSNDNFFPLDGIGWNDYHYKGDKKRNFAFCLEARTRFGYRGGEEFRFDGDDDVWVYIDNKLAIDLGSLHPRASKTVKLDILGLTRGKNYRLDFFYCERHTSESNLFLTTSLEFYCAYEDWCGICEGNGQSCCTPEMLAGECNDNNACTIDSCKVRERGCEHTPRECPNQDKCSIGSCDTKLGCQQAPLNCNPENDKCLDVSCNAATGCVRKTKNCDDGLECTIDSCEPGVGCVHRPVSCPDDGNACTVETYNNRTTGCCGRTTRNCNDNKICTADSCDVNTGCVNTPLTCDDGKKCTIDSCDAVKGCQNTPKVCGDGNKCINANCDPNTGNCVFSNVTCTTTNKCQVPSCSPDAGCTFSPRNCDDSNACTRDSCVASIGCVNEVLECNDNNACTNSTCSPSGGCVHLPIKIDDGNACTKDSCNPATGIVRTPVVCNDGKVCTSDTCDPTSGCRSVPIVCDDNNPCTVDSCDATATSSATACKNVSLPDCTVCRNSAGAEISCPTTDKCFPSICDTVNKKCSNTTLNCDDDNKCTNDGCANGECKSTPVVCTPPNPCQVASCNATTGCVFTPKSCDDFDPCTNDQCHTNGTCIHEKRGDFCVACGDSSCSWDDPCKPQTCNPTTSRCEIKDFDCNDDNACTQDRCVASGSPRRATCVHPTTFCNTTDVCNPLICDVKLGCQTQPVVCQTTNKCLNARCNNGTTGGEPCLFTAKECPTTSLCRPQVCDPVTGNCKEDPVVCDDRNPCTVDQCVEEDGKATCSFTPKDCGSDQCGVKTCNATNNGACETAVLNCDDGNDCTDDVFHCNGTHALCLYNQTTACDDNNLCTNEFCDSSNLTNPCTYSNVECTPRSVCETVVGDCDPAVGCVYVPVTCPGQNDVCKVATCDDRAGCITEDKVCTVQDSGCFYPQCDSTKPDGEQCVQKAKDNWGSRTSTNGVLCILRYDDTVRTAAIGTGAAVGIAIGAAAAAGFIGYGGKKGYDYWKGMQNDHFNGVTGNPLYETPSGSADNPLYRHSVSDI